MGALERLQIVIVSTDQVRRHRQQLEILASQRSRLISEGQRLVGIGPGPSPVVLPAPFELADHLRGRPFGSG